MSITYLLRHRRTELSARYIANGDPARRVPLDATGIAQCHRLAHAAWIPHVVTCIVSEFARTAETATQLLGRHQLEVVVDRRLNEIRYGPFEGQPWMAYGAWLHAAGLDARPPGGEARNDAIGRMFSGLAAVLKLPGPRLVVGHGLMISALLQLIRRRPLTAFQLPEAPYVTPVPLADARLSELLEDCARTLTPQRQGHRHSALP